MTDVECWGQRAWDEYYRYRELRNQNSRGRREFWTHKYKRTFLRIGEICLKNDFSVPEYVDYVLTYIQKDSDYITPKDLTESAFVTAFKAAAKTRAAELPGSWAAQLNALTMCELNMIPDHYSSLSDILADPRQNFAPWFRVMYLNPLDERIYSMYGKYANQELNMYPRLRDFLEEVAPDTLAQFDDKVKVGDNAGR